MKSYLVAGQDDSVYYLVPNQHVPKFKGVLDSHGPAPVGTLIPLTRFKSREDAQAAINATIVLRGGEEKMRQRGVPPGGRSWWRIVESDEPPTEDALTWREA